MITTTEFKRWIVILLKKKTTGVSLYKNRHMRNICENINILF